MMKRALEESQKVDADRKNQETEEEEMIRQAIEASKREEEDRQKKEGLENQLNS
jgi:hypothetical protein